MKRHEQRRLHELLAKRTRGEALAARETSELTCLVVKAKEAGLEIIEVTEDGATDIYAALSEAAHELGYNED